MACNDRNEKCLWITRSEVNRYDIQQFTQQYTCHIQHTNKDGQEI